MTEPNQMTTSVDGLLPSFKDAWAAMEAKGYRYNGNALENVRLGYEMAAEALATRAPAPSLGEDVVEQAARLEEIAKTMEFAVAGGMAWIDYSEAKDFTRRIRKVAAALSAMRPEAKASVPPPEEEDK